MSERPDETAEGAAPEGVDALIAQLGAQGEVESEGRFTLDRKVAREKLQRFQLAEPLRFALELVRCLVQRGADRIAIRVSAGNLWFQADGRPFSQRDFDRLWNALVDEAPDPTGRSLESLAMALNAALALPLAFVEVVSTGEDGGARLTVRPRQPDQYGALKKDDRPGLEPPPDWDPVTTIHVRRGGGVGLLARAVRHTLSDLPVERVLREGCRFATTRIELDGELISGAATRADRLGCAPLSGGGCQGGCWHSADAGAGALLHLVAHDVLVCTEPLVGLPPHYEAMVRCDGFDLDLSREAVVKNDRHQAALELARSGWSSAITALAKEQAHTHEAAEAAPEWALRRLRSAFRARISGPEAGEAKAAAPLLRALRHAFLWHLARVEPVEPGYVALSPVGRTATFDALVTARVADLIGCAVAGHVDDTTFAKRTRAEPDAHVVIVDDPRDQLHLEGLLGDRARRLDTFADGPLDDERAAIVKVHDPKRQRASRATGLLVLFIAFVLLLLWLSLRGGGGG